MERTAEYIRKTKETDIKINLNIDGTGKAEIDTGIGFFDHMLEGFARHGFFDLDVKVEGDLAVDCHHTIEDTGIVLGNAIRKALKNKKGIKRFGSCILPMDETLVLCAVDLSGRPYLVFDGEFTVERVGYMDTEMVKEFFYAVSYAAGMNLHIRVLSGGNNHHMIEAMFKAFARALDEATGYDPRITDVLSTKGNQKPTSFATSAQEKRVEILNKMYKNSVSIIIENKENENGVSTGTLVKIQLKPINVI
jgi:imidazoleglycerol-phosphate dehydratase